MSISGTVILWHRWTISRCLGTEGTPRDRENRRKQIKSPPSQKKKKMEGAGAMESLLSMGPKQLYHAIINVQNTWINLLVYFISSPVCLGSFQSPPSLSPPVRQGVFTYLVHTNHCYNKGGTYTGRILETSLRCVSLVHLGFPTSIHSENTMEKH